MAKITRSKLARGAKLLVEHIFTPLQSAQTNITGADGLSQDQLQCRMAPFRLNLSIPHLNSYANASRMPGSGDTTPMHAIPFMLPPLQEDLDFSAIGGAIGNVPTVGSDTPQVILDEVSFSFDTRGEPGAILSNWFSGTASGGANAGQTRISYERVGNYDIELAIMERKPTWGLANPVSFEPRAAIWTGRINPDPELNSNYERQGNPFTVSDIGQAIDPYKSYLFVISVPNLDTDGIMELVSIEASLKFYSRLRPRDSGTNIQNIPARHYGERNKLNTFSRTGAGQHSSTVRSLITGTPAVGSRIEANTSTGTQRAMAVIDEFFRAKFKGGYSMNSEVPVLESIADSAGYTCLAIPLFNNTRFGGISIPSVPGIPSDFPYMGNVADDFIDRRYVPIVAPMTIHHVLFTYSWMPFVVPIPGPTVATCNKMPLGSGAEQLKLDIGVGMGTGAMADSFGYEQVARKTLTDVFTAAWQDEAVDRIRMATPGSMPTRFNGAAWVPNAYNLELHTMDVEGAGRPGLDGMTAQGYPVFAGRSWAGSSSPLPAQRNNMATGARAKTHGAEQWLEVRASISALNNDWSAWAGDRLILGSGGIWVYIIGKTQLV